MYITEAWNIIKNGEMITLIGNKIWYLTKQSDSSLLKKAKDLGISDQDFLSNKWIQGYLGFSAPPVLKPYLGKAEKVEVIGINYKDLFHSLAMRHSAIEFHLEAGNISRAKSVSKIANDIIGNTFTNIERNYNNTTLPERGSKEV